MRLGAGLITRASLTEDAGWREGTSAAGASLLGRGRKAVNPCVCGVV